MQYFRSSPAVKNILGTRGLPCTTFKEKAQRHKCEYLKAGNKFRLARVYDILKNNSAKLFQVEKEMVDEGLLDDDKLGQGQGKAQEDNIPSSSKFEIKDANIGA